MRFRLRTLMILTAIGPPVLAAFVMLAGGGSINFAVISVAAYVGLVAMIIVASTYAESSPANPEFESQVETFDRQTRETDRLLAEQDQSVRRGEALLAKQEANAERMEKLIEKMEEQAERKDAILKAQERQLGLKQ
jgi:hypothetical protein